MTGTSNRPILCYFLLQYNRWSRILKDLGLSHIAAWIVIPLVAVIFFTVLYHKTDWATPLLLFFQAYLTIPLLDRLRNDFLKSIYSNKLYWNIKIIENCLIALPFCLAILFFDRFIFSFAPLLLSLIFAFTPSLPRIHKVMPTPFARNPFEHIRGIRNSWFFFILSLSIYVISILVNNYLLGLFCICLIGIWCMTFYDNIEHHFFIWNESRNASDFLWHKIKNGLKHTSILILPLGVFSLIVYPERYIPTLLVLIYSLSLTLLGIGSKYIKYPQKYQLKDLLLISVSVVVPPIMLLSVPYFMYYSRDRLDYYL